MSIFSRGSKKRKDFVAQQIDKIDIGTGKKYTDKGANKEYMKKKQELATDIIKTLKEYCDALCDPKTFWSTNAGPETGCFVFLESQVEVQVQIDDTMRSNSYKNIEEGGSSSKYLQKVQFELGKVITTTSHFRTDPANIKSSMQSCGKGLSKLKHPIGSTALVKVGDKGERIVDYVDELARLMLKKCVQDNVTKLVRLQEYENWPADGGGYTYQSESTKYVSLYSYI